MKKLLLFFVLFVWGTAVLQAQHGGTFNHENMTETANGMYIKERSVTETKLAAELFYFYPQYTAAKVYLQDKTIEVAEARFNLENDFLEINGPGKTSFYAPERTRGFHLQDSESGAVTYFLSVEEANSGKNYFMEVLTEGPLNVLLHHTVKIKDGSSNPALNYEKPPRVVHKQTLYVHEKGKAANRIKLSRRSVLSLFGNKAEEAHTYARQHKLSYRRQDDFVQLVAWFNALPQQESNR